MLIYATFVTGLQEPVAKWVAEEGHRVRQLLDGAILYDTGAGKKSLPCFFNTFAVLDFEKNNRPRAVEQLMRKQLSKPRLIKPTGGRGSFRIVTSQENKLIAVDKALRAEVEKTISARTGQKVERRGGGREYWFLSRSEGLCLFMERLPAGKEHKLKKGELRPQLAYCLNRFAQPRPEDVMIDPFCGYGAITKARAAHFPCQLIQGLDIEQQKIIELQKTKAPVLTYHEADIKQLSSIFPAQSVDVIVTDPPWGLFKDSDDISQIYLNLAKASSHVLKPGGRIVLLSAQKELLREQLNRGAWGSARLQASYDILVSGQKAAIFLISASAK